MAKKNRTRFLAIALFTIASALGFAQSYEPDSPEVVELKNLYIETGRSFPFTSYPISERRLVQAAQGIEPYVNSYYQKRLENIIRPLLDRPDGFIPFFRGQANLAETARNPGHSPDFDIKDYLRADPFLYVGAGVILPMRGFAYADIEARKRYENTLPVANIPLEFKNGSAAWKVEDHDVKRGVLAFFNDYVDLYIGRDKVEYGPSRSSLICDPDVPSLDSIRFEVYGGPFTLSYRVTTLDNRKAETDVIPTWPYAFGQNTIVNAVHRVQYATENATVGVTGNIFIVRPQNSFQVADVLPIISWHNADITPNNLSLILDGRYVVSPGIELAAQVGFDDINGNILGINDDSTPTIDAEIVSLSMPNWMELYLEVGHTHYLWGSFDDAVAMARAIYRVPLMGGAQAMPMTSPYGPGTVWTHAEIGKKLTKSFKAGCSVEMIGKKAGADLFTTHYGPSSLLEREGYAMSCRVKLPFSWTTASGSFSLKPEVRFENGGIYPVLSTETSFRIDG
jgi:hypothetical protein